MIVGTRAESPRASAHSAQWPAHPHKCARSARSREGSVPSCADLPGALPRRRVQSREIAILASNFVVYLRPMDRYRVEKGDQRSYLCTCTVANWLPIFNAGPQYAEIILDSLKFCRQRKGLILHGYVLMIDHLHLIVRHQDLPGVMRDFKSWTAKAIAETLLRDRRHDLLAGLKSAATHAGAHQDLKLWQDGYHPKAIQSDAMMQQKLDYVHANPVRKEFVGAAEDWRWSSARNYFSGDHSVLEVDLVAPLIV